MPFFFVDAYINIFSFYLLKRNAFFFVRFQFKIKKRVKKKKKEIFIDKMSMHFHVLSAIMLDGIVCDVND